ncbi:DUF3047 domain-containing protein [Herbaspirillum lusitanum]|uniref:DUF3047 domain-containing protein n=1 Tax=Herbaspirillum lusitanum TaxID=213312 RepID=UPI002237633B|nr:DUF3047 domain-containing protein [Herbaspirillum lusitanum]MCW5297057.1 DUF3047 domain-containing protein [Herbaspirillum lusitanum]
MKSVVTSSLPSSLRLAMLAGMVAILAACANTQKVHDPVAKQVKLDQALALFSSNPAQGLPKEWEPLSFMRKKKATEYGLVRDGDRTVLRAFADKASSGLRHEVNIDPVKQPWLSWSWKTSALIKTADNRFRDTEDSPVRIVLAFDGDKNKLSFMDTILFDTAKLLSGHEFPYATLMYIWENKAPKESVIANTRTGRIQMLVAESGAANVGQWVSYQRNIVDDYVKVYGEQPGRLIGVGVLTDTDNTEGKVEAWYGDIRLLRQATVARQAASPQQ